MTNKYEIMVIIRPDLSNEERGNLVNQIKEVITKKGGTVSQDAVWSEKRKFYFVIKKYREGVYLLINFSLPPEAINEISLAYNINDNILRYLITRQ